MTTEQKRGFTIVELLIVIVVIGILAAITMVTYNGMNVRSRDSARKQDVVTIVKALELYYADKGSYPNSTNYTPGSTAINGSWSTTADGSWSNLAAALAPYTNKLPRPVGATNGTAAMNGGNNYDYFGTPNSNYCGVGPGQMYILLYRLEGVPLVNTFEGDCSVNTLGPYGNGSSNYRSVKK
jgi:prepilin-type N-terminal cleavage/methylation domain-containing protein